jgi:trimeric autotransporter adhesin
VFVYDAIPANTDLYVTDIGAAGSGPVAFSNGTPTSALTYTFTSLASTTDDVAFSNDGGATYTYTPVANGNGVDPNVTHIRINPKGTFAGDPVAGAPSPNFTASLRVRIE